MFLLLNIYFSCFRLAAVSLWILTRLTRTSNQTHSVWRGVVSVLCRAKKFWTHPWVPVQIGIAKGYINTNPPPSFVVRRPQYTKFCPFSHVSWVETLWTEKWKGCLGILLLFTVQLAGRAGCVGQAPGCSTSRTTMELAIPFSPCNQVRSASRSTPNSKTLVETERCHCKDIPWATHSFTNPCWILPLLLFTWYAFACHRMMKSEEFPNSCWLPSIASCQIDTCNLVRFTMINQSFTPFLLNQLKSLFGSKVKISGLGSSNQHGFLPCKLMQFCLCPSLLTFRIQSFWMIELWTEINKV